MKAFGNMAILDAIREMRYQQYPEFGAEPLLRHWGSDPSPLPCLAWEAGTGLLEGRACVSAPGMPAFGAATHGNVIVQAMENPATVGLTVRGSGRIHTTLFHTEHPLTWAEH